MKINHLLRMIKTINKIFSLNHHYKNEKEKKAIKNPTYTRTRQCQINTV